MKPDLHGAIIDCEKIKNPHSKAQVQQILLDAAEHCAGCRHGYCTGCHIPAQIKTVRMRSLELIGQNCPS